MIGLIINTRENNHWISVNNLLSETQIIILNLEYVVDSL